MIQEVRRKEKKKRERSGKPFDHAIFPLFLFARLEGNDVFLLIASAMDPHSPHSSHWLARAYDIVCSFWSGL